MSRFSCTLVVGAVLAAANSALADGAYPAVLTLRVTHRHVCEGKISPYQCGQFIEYLCGADAVDVRREGIRRQFRGRAPLPRRLPQGRPTASSSPGIPTAPCTAASSRSIAIESVQRQGLAAHSAEERRSLHAGDFAGRQVRQGRRGAAVLAAPPRGAGEPARFAWRSGATARPTPRPSSGLRSAGSASRRSLSPTDTDDAGHVDDFVPRAGHALDRSGLADARTDTSSAGDATWPRPSRPCGRASFVSAAARPRASSGPPPSATRPSACRSRRAGAAWSRATPASRSSSNSAGGSAPSRLICVRFTGKTPKDAADQVEYFNGPATTPMGKLRAANGHAAPYRRASTGRSATSWATRPIRKAWPSSARP